MIDANREAIEENYRNTLLDDTKTSMHLAETAVPDEAFKYLLMRVNAISKDLAVVTFKLKDQNGNPVRGVRISGLIDANGNAIYTDNSGVASGYASVGSKTFTISGYGDITDTTTTKNLIAGAEYHYDWNVARRNFLSVTGSRNIRFTPDCPTISFTLCGGGGGGGDSGGDYSYYTFGGAGGGGGHSIVATDISVEAEKDYYVAIAAGGTGGVVSGAKPTIGGTSSAFGMSATGGNPGERGLDAASRVHDGPSSSIPYSNGAVGGTGNGNGGNGAAWDRSLSSDKYELHYESTAAGDGTEVMYTSYTTESTCGGGGGGGHARGVQSGPRSGGSPNGGYGGGVSTDGNEVIGHAGGQPGGGGGGGSINRETYRNGPGGNGGNGACAIRMHLSVTI